MHSEDERGRNSQGWRSRDNNDWEDRRHGNQYGGEGTYGDRPGAPHHWNTYPFSGQYGNQGFGYQGNQGFTQGSRGYFDEGRSHRDYEPAAQGWSEPWRGRGDPWQSRGGLDERTMRGTYAGGAYSGAQDWRDNDQRWNEPQRGNYSGKGPRGYRRSDERVREDVSDALTRDPNVDATDIEVRVSNGEVTLAGTVADRHQKRQAEMCTERIDGVLDVHNQIRVTQEGNQKEMPPSGRSTKT